MSALKQLLGTLAVVVGLMAVSAVVHGQEQFPSAAEKSGEVSADRIVNETPDDADTPPEDLSQWSHFSLLSIPAGLADDQGTAGLVDFLVPADMFGIAKPDLSDLRIISSGGSVIPYAVRVLSPRSVQVTLPATEFNRSEPSSGVQELTLELPDDDREHNEVIVETSGNEFRRAVVISGSDDGREWTTIAKGHVINYQLREPSREQSLVRKSFDYPASRHRYVRVRVTADPQNGEENDNPETFELLSVSVMQLTSRPGLTVQTDGQVSSREPTRTLGTPGSRWIIDLQHAIPCDRLEFEIADEEFVRSVGLEAENRNHRGQMVFQSIYLENTSQWQRSRGEKHKPLVLQFPETMSRRLRLTVSDFRNKPLTITSVKAMSAARQIVFRNPGSESGTLKVYLGNPNSETANYDFAAGLSETLPGVPIRAAIAATETHADYTPPAKPLTERLPWLIYLALGSVCAVLGIVIVNLSRTVIGMQSNAEAQPDT